MEKRIPEPSRVIVIGGGPVGLVTALLLADAGVATTVVERALAPGDLPRAISLQDESFRVFEQLGIADALKSESLLDTGSRYFGLNGRLLAEAKPSPSRLGHPAKTQFDQPILEQLLFDRAVEHPGVTLLLGTEATAITHDVNGVTVHVTERGVTRQLSAEWLVGADGGRSFTRSALGIRLDGSTQTQRWIVVDLLNERAQHEPFAEFHCDGKRPYVLVPGVNGRLRIEFMLFDHEDPDEMTTPTNIRNLLVPAFRNKLLPGDVRRAAVYVAHQRVAHNYRSGRAFLVGDAAHLMPPFAGQGLNAGVRDAANLAWKLIEAIKGGASERLLDSYEIERRAHGAKMVKISRRVGAVVMATNPLATQTRDAVVRLVNLVPSARRYLANMRFITPPDYSAGVAVLPGDGPKFAGVQIGRALSQPTVTDVDGNRAGLDTYLGRGWALIGVGINPEKASAYWNGIDATRIHLLPPGVAPQKSAAGAEVIDLAETAAALTGATGGEPVFIAVRPDRYVAAVFAASDEQRVVEELRNFIDDRAREARSPQLDSSERRDVA
ncbi:bifunctional 3-(3-hydroxy-phenyl)propionate/3-hydroxycinnamic acid hydroxylase [Mycetocola zhadangensis]|uniref:bifunctional 3-(3-hydroxy-phenyl)propionate/3-hydroxycinnamic acid hydroxylase n=1 Tax=Mycetocola zhadangensis TaxID=1164595 RepID=UPI001601B510|nr:bifunctional 3-(3-hydroxy-phenyl)propionate/3-hydroxycinnamic acid hydroxylase [Mycetocola zhadangensis]GGF00110.1 3-(3-hydroxy-phenyl)propionate/3-hydroxycinnamic acid hydroxylase [Mycetocola zhadangensis]